ncbi:hypothetical protein [uncultured Shewanella sp.]|uniref:hypothetical protein n=1 Tax=uncultured Shewanella sp. TaxID=173975 RepID=UPI002611DE14|nr:hypothetical protein [uncultured Shewanella sp.]
MAEPLTINVSGNMYDVELWLWEHLVPSEGKAASLQGEAMRAIELLAWEAQNNGNLNWNASFDELILFLRHFFLSGLAAEASLYDSHTQASIDEDLIRLTNFLMPTELDSRVYPDELPYTDQDLYDRLISHLVCFCRHFPVPIYADNS